MYFVFTYMINQKPIFEKSFHSDLFNFMHKIKNGIFNSTLIFYLVKAIFSILVILIYYRM